jgi:hypothetical protein
MIRFFPALELAMMTYQFKPSANCSLELEHENVVLKICSILQCIETLDKRNWHHKPTYLVYNQLMIEIVDNGEYSRTL